MLTYSHSPPFSLSLSCHTSIKPSHMHLLAEVLWDRKWASEDKSNPQVKKCLTLSEPTWILRKTHFVTQPVVSIGLSNGIIHLPRYWHLNHSWLNLHMTHSSLPHPITASRFFWADASIKYHFWIMSAEMKGCCLWLHGQMSCIYFSVIGPGWLILSPAFDGLGRLYFKFIVHIL